MNQENVQDWGAYADVVESNINEFVEELRAIDVVDLVSFIRMERFPNIEDLVNSSTELFFKSEMLVFAWVAGVDLRWETRPTVILGMEFRHPTVSVFFNLSLGAAERAVEVLGVAFEQAWHDPVGHLRHAFREARLRPSHRNPLAVASRRGASKPPSAR